MGNATGRVVAERSGWDFPSWDAMAEAFVRDVRDAVEDATADAIPGYRQAVEWIADSADVLDSHGGEDYGRTFAQVIARTEAMRELRAEAIEWAGRIGLRVEWSDGVAGYRLTAAS